MTVRSGHLSDVLTSADDSGVPIRHHQGCVANNNFTRVVNAKRLDQYEPQPATRTTKSDTQITPTINVTTTTARPKARRGSKKSFDFF